MPFLTIYRDEQVNSTIVPNQFIDDYMKDANDAQLKIYLYLLRMMNARQATSVSDIADKFNHTEKDVIRALKYWQKLHLLDLDYDSGKNLTGIHIRDLDSPGGSGAGRDSGTVSSFIPEPAPPEAADFLPMKTEPPEIAGSPSAAVSSAGSTASYEKPSYSADQLREFKNRQDTAQLLFIAESYIGKPLTPSEIKTILYFTDVLHFSDDLIDYLIQYCVDKGKKDFKYIEKVAVNWAEEGISTPKQARRTAGRYDKNVYTIMRGLGKDGSPTGRELEYINRWLKEYGFSTDIILEACERTVLATDKHRFEYADSILNSWKCQNVHQKSDIRGIDDLYRQRKKTQTPSKQNNNRFNQFPQNNYDFDVLEQELLSN
ncbi:MAG: DnaD domain protein [Lachnospiraceae bacterium]|nr:DnaD domain protein [Lachnospiraceae bacterium]